MKNAMQLQALSLLQKLGYTPPDAGMQPPMDPNAMAAGAPPPAPPMDPNAMAAGAPPMPMDPAMMGGGAPMGVPPMPPADPNAMPGGMMPPMDPNAIPGGTMPPMDPNAMPGGTAPLPPPGGGEALPPVMLNLEDLKAVFDDAVKMATGGEGIGSKPEESEAFMSRLDGIEQMLGMLMDHAGLQVPEKPFSPKTGEPPKGAEEPGPLSGFSPEALKTASEEALKTASEMLTPEQRRQRWIESLVARRNPETLHFLKSARGQKVAPKD